MFPGFCCQEDPNFQRLNSLWQCFTTGSADETSMNQVKCRVQNKDTSLFDFYNVVTTSSYIACPYHVPSVGVCVCSSSFYGVTDLHFLQVLPVNFLFNRAYKKVETALATI